MSVMSTINIICIHTSYAAVMFTICGIKCILFYAYSSCRCLVLVKRPLCPLLCCWWMCLLYSCSTNPWLYFDGSYLKQTVWGTWQMTNQFERNGWLHTPIPARHKSFDSQWKCWSKLVFHYVRVWIRCVEVQHQINA